jgi:hypothetical protein
MIRGAHEFPVAATGERNRVQAHFAGCHQSLRDVRRVTAGGGADGSVPAMPESFDLPRKDSIEPVIIADGSDANAGKAACRSVSGVTLMPLGL